MYSFLLLFLATATAQAQNSIVSFGVKGGIPLTEATASGSRSVSLFSGTNLIPLTNGVALHTITTGRWTVGPTVEFHLPWNFSVEFDALYRTFRSGSWNTSRYQPGWPVAIQTFTQDVKAWDLPLLVKYRFPGEKVRPFILGGKTWTHESRQTSFSSVCTGAEPCSPPESLASFPGLSSSNQTVVRDGVVAGGGVEFKYRRLSFFPELRYTRMLQPRSNQVTLLVGITF
jgi:hypothetical protein